MSAPTFHCTFSSAATSVSSPGNPFNITTGQDNNGDTIFNDRPSFATDLTRPSVVRTAYGNFDTSPIAGQTIIPINYGHGPGFFLVNLNLGRSFSFGPVIKPATPPRLAPGQKAEVDRRYKPHAGHRRYECLESGQPAATRQHPQLPALRPLHRHLQPGQPRQRQRVVNLEAFLRF